jgi:fumarate hydratase, class II
MPGKVNPVIPESVRQVCAQVMGNDVAVGIGGMSGDLELNVMIPMMVRNVIESENLLANVSRVFVDKCIAGITETGQGTAATSSGR